MGTFFTHYGIGSYSGSVCRDIPRLLRSFAWDPRYHRIRPRSAVYGIILDIPNEHFTGLARDIVDIPPIVRQVDRKG
jgi:hypothetical protein